MKIALFSDIHANLPALEAAFADIDSRKPDAIYCLGDLVGYNIWPNEVINEIRKRGTPTIAGNYDFGIGLSSNDCGCAYKTDNEKELGKISISYTNQVIGTEERAYLRTLPAHIRVEFQLNEDKLNLLLVHGSPRKINEYLFENRDEKSMLRIMETSDADILCFGHTHKPYHRIIQSEVISESKNLVQADAISESNNLVQSAAINQSLNSVQAKGESMFQYRHAINIGSVGKPKDGDARGGYVMLIISPESSKNDKNSIKVEFIRFNYDIERAAQAIEKSLLPNEYAEMLRKG